MAGREFYANQQRKAKRWWAYKERANYKLDVWHNRTSNKLALKFIGDIEKGKDVLSIGARGWVERELLESLTPKSLTKIDIIGSEEEGVIEADACNLPFGNGSFNLAICREVIEHVDSAEDLLNEAWRVLKPDGYLFITTPNLYTWSIDMTSHVRLFSPWIFLKALRNAGFSPIKKGGNIPYIFDTLYPIGIEITRRTYDGILKEFIKLNEKFQKWDEAYYFSTQMMVLARKGSHDKKQSTTKD